MVERWYVHAVNLGSNQYEGGREVVVMADDYDAITNQLHTAHDVVKILAKRIGELEMALREALAEKDRMSVESASR